MARSRRLRALELGQTYNPRRVTALQKAAPPLVLGLQPTSQLPGAAHFGLAAAGPAPVSSAPETAGDGLARAAELNRRLGLPGWTA